MCRENADMRWQFGGNFQPVRMICQETWKECPIAILNYVWSEVVSEVVDYLSNDVLVWRVIAMILVFIMLIHTVYYKLRWIDETSVNRDNLNRVGFKVQDLELKVNILTYKMQYGTWPLPHHMRKSEVGNELHNVRLTLSNSEERNSWIKHLLLSPTKNKEYNFFNKNLVHSVKSISKLLNFETKYASSKFENAVSPIESGEKIVRNSCDNTRKWKRCKKCFDITLSKQKQISKSENLGLRRRQNPKSISCLKETKGRERNDFQDENSNLSSNETFIIKNESQDTGKIEKTQNQELYESCSENMDTYSDRNLHEENQLERNSSELSKESDINYNAQLEDEGRSGKAETPQMDSFTRTEKNPEFHVDVIDSNSEIQQSAKSTDGSFYSWSDYNTVENSPRNEALKFLPPSLNISFVTDTSLKPLFDKPTESVYEVSSHPNSLINTRETLHQVKDNLESVHDLLLAFESIDRNENDCNSIFKNCILYKDAKSKKSSKVSFNTDIEENLITEEEIQNSSEYEQCESIIQSSSTSISVESYSKLLGVHKEVVVQNPNYDSFDLSDSISEDEKTQTMLENSSDVSINTFTKIQVESRENLSESKSDFVPKSHNSHFNRDQITSHDQNYITDHGMTDNYIPMDASEDQIFLSSSRVEFSNDESSDNQSTSALLQEALQVKDALVSQLEWEKELKIDQKYIIKEKEDEHDFRKNSWPKVDNYFQTNILDIITEEQSASSSTEKTSKTFVMLKVSEKQELPPHQRMEENSKSALAPTSPEYSSFCDSTQSDKARSESEILSDDKNRNECQTDSCSPSNRSVMNSEISPNDLVKQSKYMIPEENEGKENKSDKENFTNSKQFENLKENFEEENPKGKVDTENIKEYSLKIYEQDSGIQKVEEQYSNELPPVMNSSSDESLTQFIKELTIDKVKAAKIFRESKLNLNSTKIEEKSLDVNKAQEQECTLTLTRRPGSFSLAEDESKEKLSKISDSNLIPDSESMNSEMEVMSKPIPMEIDAGSKIMVKVDECQFEEEKHMIGKNINEIVQRCENINDASNFDFDEIKSNTESTGESFRVNSIKEETSVESIIEVSERISECGIFQQLPEVDKSNFSLKEDSFEKSDSNEKVDKSQSNATSEPSSSLYFTTEASNSDINLHVKSLTSSTFVSKTNLEIQETIHEDASEILMPENKMFKNDNEKLDEEPIAKEEVMLIDLSDDDISGEKTKIEKTVTNRDVCSDDMHSERENLNILDTTLGGKIEENICLIPNKIQVTNKSDTIFNNSSGIMSHIEAKDKNSLRVSEISLFEKPTVNPLSNKMKISEMNKFSHCSSTPSLQRLLCNSRKSSFVNNSNSVRSKKKIEIPVKSRPLVKSAGLKEESVENFEENTSTEKELKTKSYLNLNLSKQSSGDQFQRRSRSFVSPRMIQTSPQSSNNLHYEERIDSARDSSKSPMEMDQHVRFTSRTSIKSFESQISSRSCIPILKTRLENVKKSEHKSRNRSPIRGPLTISPRPDGKDLRDTRDFNARIEVNREKNDCNEKCFGDNSGTARNLLEDQCQELNGKPVIYVNIMTDQDQSKKKVVDPKKFLEFVKDREFKIQNIYKEEKSETNSAVEKDSRRNLQSKFSFQVEQKEREISVKPSVIDNSTSVSDFPEFCDDRKQVKSKFEIFQVPEELTKEEYINLLDSLNQDPNLEQLKKMHKLCNKLGVGFQE